jgi:hypothetical protein
MVSDATRGCARIGRTDGEQSVEHEVAQETN